MLPYWIINGMFLLSRWGGEGTLVFLTEGLHGSAAKYPFMVAYIAKMATGFGISDLENPQVPLQVRAAQRSAWIEVQFRFRSGSGQDQVRFRVISGFRS